MFRNKNIVVAFFFVAIFLFSLLFYHDTISEFPRGVHAWTQSDRYAIALKYFENGFDFFHPATYNLKGKEGITQVDFPVHEYLVAIAMKFTGTTEPVIFRLYTWLISLIGLFFLFKLCYEVTENYFHSLLFALFVFTLPVCCYYRIGFIPSATSFSEMLIGVYYLYIYEKYKTKKYFYLSTVFITLAALSRLPFAIFLFALFGSVILSEFKNKKIALMKSLLVALGISAVILYYMYNQYLAKEYGTIFWMSPLYIGNIEMLKEILVGIWDKWITEYFTLYHYLFFLTLVIVAVVNRKKVIDYFKQRKQFTLWVLFSLLGACAYFFVNGRQYIDHDYYFIDSFLLPLLMLFLLLFRFVKFEGIAHNIIFSSFLLFLFTLSAYNCYASQQKRFAILDYDECEMARQSFIDGDKYLDGLGISRDDKLLVIQAYTYNTPFIYLKRMGYTALICSYGDMKPELLEKDFDYVVIPNRFVATSVLPYAPYLLNRLQFYSTNGKITVYQLIKNVNPDLKSFMGLTEGQIIDSRILFKDSVYETKNRFIDTLDFLSPLHSYKNDGTQEYSPAYELRDLSFLKKGNKTTLLVKAKFKNLESRKIFCVVSVDNSTSNLFYNNFLFDIENVKVGGDWQDVFCGFTLPANLKDAETLKLYFWNPNKIPFWLDDVEVMVYSSE